MLKGTIPTGHAAFRCIVTYGFSTSVSILFESSIFALSTPSFNLCNASLSDFKSIPLVGLAVAFFWSIYNLLRKKINVDTDIGLFVESLFILPFAIIIFYFLVKNNVNDFTLSNPSLMLLLFLAGPMTVIPLFLFIKGVALSGLGPSGMIFFIAPTGQFLLGFFFYNELLLVEKLISFILIWIAVIIYLEDLNQKQI